MEGAPGGPRKGTYGALGSCLGSGGGGGDGGGGVVEEDGKSLSLARGGGTALVRRTGPLAISGIAVEDAWRVRMRRSRLIRPLEVGGIS